MKSQQTARVYHVNSHGRRTVVPETRRGSPVIRANSDEALTESLSKLETHEYFRSIQKRIELFTERTQTDLDELKAAVDQGTMEDVAEAARRLTDHSGRMGAIKMMRQCIALQMVARRNMLSEANILVQEIHAEFTTLKQTYVRAG